MPLGTNYYRSPRLSPRRASWPTAVTFSASAHSLVILPFSENASPSYPTILKHPSRHIFDLSLRTGEADPFFRYTLLRREMAGDRRKPSFSVPDWGTCHKRAGWCPNMMGSDPCICAQLTTLTPPSTTFYQNTTAGYMWTDNQHKPSTELNPRPSRSPGSRPLLGFRSLLLYVPESENGNYCITHLFVR